MKKVTKVIIPAAGFGTRFLPATKAQPKEMLPVVDKPVIQYVVEEAVASGITDVIIVTSWQKRSLEDHFDYSPELEKQLKESGKTDKLEEIRAIAQMANFIYVRQKGPYGNATPVLSAQHLIGNDEPFAVLWGDEFIYGKPPRLKQLIDAFDTYQKTVISGLRVPKNRLNQYGIADIEPIADNIYNIKSIVEKPEPAAAPSDLGLLGGYVFTPAILKYLNEITPGKDGELWLIDAVNSLMKEESVYACEIQNAHYYDTGSKLEYLKANIDFALQRDDLRNDLMKYIKELV